MSFLDYSGLFAVLAIIAILAILFLILCFVLFGCMVFTNPMCDSCQENIEKNLAELQNNVEWVKHTTHIRILGKWKIPKHITEGMYLYELKAKIHNKGWEFINSKMMIRVSGHKESVLQEEQSHLLTSGEKQKILYP